MDITSVKKLFFIQHSTYLFQSEECWLLFDFYDREEDVLAHLEKSPTLPLFVFCTHSHGDHYNAKVFSVFKQHRSGVHFIFHDELMNKVPCSEKSNMTFLKTEESFTNDYFTVKAYGSTDLGGSFFITLRDGYTLFHAGDLNFWHWNQEASPEYITQYRKHWENELQRVAKDVSTVDLLMFPTDLRLGPDYLLGLKQFVEVIETKSLAPMHINGQLDDWLEFLSLKIPLLTDVFYCK